MSDGSDACGGRRETFSGSVEKHRWEIAVMGIVKQRARRGAERVECRETRLQLLASQHWHLKRFLRASCIAQRKPGSTDPFGTGSNTPASNAYSTGANNANIDL
eukprot:1029515-Rhodomonas_salina.2